MAGGFENKAYLGYELTIEQNQPVAWRQLKSAPIANISLLRQALLFSATFPTQGNGDKKAHSKCALDNKIVRHHLMALVTSGSGKEWL
ncbi:TPA: hypothetical protein RQJ38_002283 [Vibrio vulnificus]|uniref:hypothetical protein n=1 Tax=Vibrio vulnificus TaxID=672 RepID=UPI001D224268|nr:hypothetical protein [Vibrio vulnificus]HDY7427245.1 hypothetical protein [Vibrio vulnificus]